MKKIYLFLLLLPSLLTACIEQELSDMNESDQTSYLALNALWNSEDTAHYVHLFKTGLVEAEQLKVFTSELRVNGQLLEPDRHSAFHYRPQTGDHVELSAEWQGKRVSASTDVQQPLIIEGVDTLHIVKLKSGEGEIDEQGEYCRCMIHLRLPEETSRVQFYRFEQWDAQITPDCIYEKDSICNYVRDYIRRVCGYSYECDRALNENKNMMADYSDDFTVDISKNVPNVYGLFSSRSFENGRYTLVIDLPLRDPLVNYTRTDVVEGEYGADNNRVLGDMNFGTCLEHHFRILTLSKMEYNYLWAVAALTEMYEPGDLASNPPVVPTNVEGGTGIFSIGAAARTSFTEFGSRVHVGDTIDLSNVRKRW